MIVYIYFLEQFGICPRIILIVNRPPWIKYKSMLKKMEQDHSSWHKNKNVPEENVVALD